MAELFKAMARSPPTKRRKWTIVEIVEHFCVFVHAFRWESRFETKDFVTGGKLRMFIIVELFCVPSCYVLFIWAWNFLCLVKFCGTATTATHADSNRICVVTFAVNCFQLVLMNKYLAAFKLELKTWSWWGSKGEIDPDFFLIVPEKWEFLLEIWNYFNFRVVVGYFRLNLNFTDLFQ